jgi:hypothetical protein
MPGFATEKNTDLARPSQCHQVALDRRLVVKKGFEQEATEGTEDIELNRFFLVRPKPTASGRATLKAMPVRGEFVNRVWAQKSHRLVRWIVRFVATKTASIIPECHRLVRWIVTLPSYEPETPPGEPVGSFRTDFACRV